MFLVGSQRREYPLHTAFSHRTKFSGYKLRIKFDKDSLAIKQNNYVAKIVNAYIVYELNV